MGIPRIRPYEMPEASALPQSRASFELRADRAVLLVHDVQRYFVDFFDATREPVLTLKRNVGALIAAARDASIPVVYTAQPKAQSPVERGLLNEVWGAGITAAPREHVAIVDELAPRPGDHVLTKWRYSAFRRTPLREMMEGWGRDQLIVTGVYAHIGCLLTVADAFMSDVRAFLVGDAVADFSRADHEAALRYVADCCGVVIDTRALLAAFGARATPHATRGETEMSTQEISSALYGDVAREVAALLDVDPARIGPEDSLLDWGLDSIRIMTLVERWQARGVDVTFVTLAEAPTLSDYARLFE